MKPLLLSQINVSRVNCGANLMVTGIVVSGKAVEGLPRLENGLKAGMAQKP